MPVFEPRPSDWKILPESEALDVMRAQINPVRRAILRLLGLGPMRKSELARHIHRGMGKKYCRSLVQHHLKQLERAGLIGYLEDPDVSSKAKLVYRAARVRVQLKPEPVPKGAPKIPEEIIESELGQRLKEE